MPTPRFGLTSGLDNDVVDAVLAALEIHNHQGGSRLGDPTGTPSSALVTINGSLPGSATYVYRYALVDQFGFETAASPEITQSTPAVLTAPLMPVTTSEFGGTLAQGIYYVYLTTLAGAEETSLSQPSMVSLITGEGTILTQAPTETPEGATGWRVWRQGPGEAAPTKIGTIALGGDPLVDDGTVPPDHCACDPANQPPAFNRTNATNSITVSLSETDAARVLANDSPVLMWRLYRATSSGGYTSRSLLHQVVETDPLNGRLLTSWTDTGTETLATGAPSEVSRTLKPSVAIKHGGAGGAGPLQLRTTAGTMWALTADADGALVTDPSGFLPVSRGYLHLAAADLSTWRLDVDTDGALVTTAHNPTDFDEVYLEAGPVVVSPDPTLGYQLSVDTDGALSTTAVGVAHSGPKAPQPSQTVGDGTPTFPAPQGSIYFDRSDSYQLYVQDQGLWQT